ncbi:cytochrome P450 [Streptomyces sp. ET3-23]|uniref:cytochrome P450 n=1 Tax=Streptomyces sp. ET3-23 TaxID=2885643 RepID=UPI001D125A2B|nr:cytochrome P450 [Streptomyces sp. ET3-23]MCC2275493.1 cytochrome P450 [Streptomyces sp. ET3-23]
MLIADAPGRWPVLGHAPRLLRAPLAFLTSLPAHGDLVRVRIGPATAVLVCDPELTYQVLHDDRTFDKGGPIYDHVRKAMGNGLVSCTRGQHRRQRRLCQPAFHPNRIPGYADVMAAQAAAVAGSWRDGDILDVNAEMFQISIRTVMTTLFADALPPTVLRHALDDVSSIFDGVFRQMLTPPPLDRLPTPANRRYHHARIRMRATLARAIADRRANDADHGDLLSAMLAAPSREDGDDRLTDVEIADQAVTFFIGGSETVAATLSWALYLLAQHPDVADRLRAEADTVLQGRPAAHADLPSLELARRIVTETLRLWPPAWLLTRMVTSDTELGGQPLPAGTVVAYSPYLIHRRPDLYIDPDRFDPGRWEGRQQPPREAFIPFGGGARKCIGDTFAFTEATLALATITARWSLHLLPGQHFRPAVGATVTPRGLRMRAVAKPQSALPGMPQPRVS